YRFQDVALAGRELVDRQRYLPPRGTLLHRLQEFVDFRDDLRPRRLSGEWHVIFAVELHEAAVGNKTGHVAADFDRHNDVAFQMQGQSWGFHPARGFAYVGLPSDLEQ